LVLYFGKILHNFRKSECFRQMSSVTISLASVSHIKVGVLLRFWVGEKCCNQTGVATTRMKPL